MEVGVFVSTGSMDPPPMTRDPVSGPTSHTYRARRLRLHYVDWGNEQAPTALLVHGGQDHCRNWDWVAADLRRDHHVVAPDLVGHGDSDWSADGYYSPQAAVYDLHQLITQQALGHVDLIAHSLGGIIAMRFAGVFPELVRRLVVIEGLGFDRDFTDPPPIETRIANWAVKQRDLSGRLPRRYRTLAQATARMQDANKHLSQLQAEHLTRYGVMQNEDGTYSWKFDNYTRLRQPADLTREEIHRLWSRITCPVLHVHGSESWVRPPAEGGLLTHFADATVAELAGCGHWVHHDRLDAFLAVTREFLARP
jgi:pimeloyl-ACP methyl ester carboxylesterase